MRILRKAAALGLTDAATVVAAAMLYGDQRGSG